MIKSFRGKSTEKLFNGIAVRKWNPIGRQARRRLVLLHAAASLEALAVVPGNRLHQLVGDRKGQHAIRINDQWRICFRWYDGDAYDVEIVDYH
jgi:proteic killer suppression protein